MLDMGADDFLNEEQVSRARKSIGAAPNEMTYKQKVVHHFLDPFSCRLQPSGMRGEECETSVMSRNLLARLFSRYLERCLVIFAAFKVETLPIA